VIGGVSLRQRGKEKEEGTEEFAVGGNWVSRGRENVSVSVCCVSVV